MSDRTPKPTTPRKRPPCPHPGCKSQRTTRDALGSFAQAALDHIPAPESVLTALIALCAVGYMLWVWLWAWTSISSVGDLWPALLNMLLTHPLLDAEFTAAALAVGSTWVFRNQISDRLPSTSVRCVGGPYHEDTIPVRGGRVTCGHGYAVSALCWDCRRQWCVPSSVDWYTLVTDDLAVFTPPTNPRLLGPNTPPVDARLAAACRILALVATDTAVSHVAANLLKLITTLLAQEQRNDAFEEAVAQVERQTITAVLASTKVTSAQGLATSVTAEGEELSDDERAQITSANKLLKQVQKELLPSASPTTRGSREELATTRQELRTALAAKPAQAQIDTQAVDDVLEELQISESGLGALREVPDTLSPTESN